MKPANLADIGGIFLGSFVAFLFAACGGGAPDFDRGGAQVAAEDFEAGNYRFFLRDGTEGVPVIPGTLTYEECFEGTVRLERLEPFKMEEQAPGTPLGRQISALKFPNAYNARMKMLLDEAGESDCQVGADYDRALLELQNLLKRSGPDRGQVEFTESGWWSKAKFVLEIVQVDGRPSRKEIEDQADRILRRNRIEETAKLKVELKD